MKKIRTCVVVADGAKVKLFINLGPGKGLEMIKDGSMEKKLKPAREFGTERPGRVRDSASGTRHAVEMLDWHSYEKHLFAKEIAKLINSRVANNEFERLVIVAPAKVLGDMKKELDKNSLSIFISSLSKDLTNCNIQEITDHLKEVMVL